MEKRQQDDNRFVSPSGFIQKELQKLPERTREVLIKRFDLDGMGKKTLEKTGRSFKITRERVRQIEKATIEKIKADNASALSGVFGESVSEIGEISRIFKEIIIQHGGIIEREYFFYKALEYFHKFIPEEKRNKSEKQYIALILRATGAIKRNFTNEKLKDFFFLDREEIRLAEAVVDECEKIFSETGEVMTGSEIYIKAMRTQALSGKKIGEEVFCPFLYLSRNLAKNIFSEWGFASWPLIFPKGVKDKIYLVLRHKKKPLHFKEIAALVGSIWKKNISALEETAHNELIKNKQFVLIGRGIYALAEWGYERGSVHDIIKSVIMKAGQPISSEEIIKQVLCQRLVKPGTIILNLKNKNVFEKTETGFYKLKT